MSANTSKPPLVYIVDDEPLSAEIVAELLELQGYSTRIFHDSGSAAEELRRTSVKPDLLLADYSMPGMNGLQLLATSKAENCELRTVLMSGLDREDTLQAGAFRPDRFLTKPFPMMALLQSVRTALHPES